MRFNRKLFKLFLPILCVIGYTVTPVTHAYDTISEPLGSLQSYTGILHMPNARVKSDWSIRLKIGHNDPYTYYGGALGVFDRFEFHGQFTQVNTIEAFEGEGYGDYKDRNAGMRVVLFRENDFLPQISAGFYDAIGTGLFPFRYIVASKMIGRMDLTIGLGQGILAGDYPRDEYSGDDIGRSLLFSTPFRNTKPFLGMEWHYSPKLSFSAEYSSINWSNMFGYRDNAGNELKKDDSLIDINLGLKYKLTDHLHATGAVIGGNQIAGGVNFELPLNPEGVLPWKKPLPYKPAEKFKWRIADSNKKELSILTAEEIKNIGFSDVSVACNDDSIWVEFANTVHLSDAKAVGRVGSALNEILPDRIQTFYINLKENSTVITSLRLERERLTAFIESNTDEQGLLAFSNLTLYKTKNGKAFKGEKSIPERYHAKEPKFSYSIEPKIRTFLNNRAGFFKHKGVLRARSSYRLWQGAALLGELEYTLFNEYDELVYNPLEGENAVKTDMVEYETGQELRLSQLAYNQFIGLPSSIQGRFSAGYFETQYAGFGIECFRYFNNGLWGIGFDSQLVKKRDPNATLKVHEKYDDWYKTAFLNIYAQVYPPLGIESGLKIGRFLAGDPGIRIELRRSHKYFTIGAWYTRTDTDLFVSEKNKEADQKGVYISFPLSIFSNKDKPNRLRYTFSSFTRDQGARVRQPGALFPMDPYATPNHLRKNLADMRQ